MDNRNNAETTRGDKGLFPNHARAVLEAGELALGFGVYHLRTVATPMIAATSGYDWLFILGEHGSFSTQEVAQLCLSALPAGVTPIVQINKRAFDEGSRALDNGAQGLIVPHVDTAEEARQVVDAFRYPPLGHRSWGGPPALYRFSPPDLRIAQAEINGSILLVCMLESPESIANADEIAAVEGIDVLLVGANDLSAEMGIPGQVGAPEIREAIATVATACERHGKIMGLGGAYDPANLETYIKLGARFVLAGSDQSFVISAAKAKSEKLRDLDLV